MQQDYSQSKLIINSTDSTENG